MPFGVKIISGCVSPPRRSNSISDAGVFPKPGKIDGGSGSKRSSHAGRARSSGGGLPWWAVALGTAALVAAAVLALALGRLAAGRRGAGQERLAQQIVELRAALRRLEAIVQANGARSPGKRRPLRRKTLDSRGARQGAP